MAVPPFSYTRDRSCSWACGRYLRGDDYSNGQARRSFETTFSERPTVPAPDGTGPPPHAHNQPNTHGVEIAGSSAVTRLAAVSLMWCTLSASCAAQDRSGADCLNEGVTRLGTASVTVTCDVGERMMLVGIPPQERADVEPSADEVPKETSALIRRARSDGYNWCVVPSGQLATLVSGKDTGELKWECRRVLATFERYLVATGNSFEITLARGADASAFVSNVIGRAR